MPSSKPLILILSLLSLNYGLVVTAQFELPGQDTGEKDRTDMEDIPLEEPEGILSFVDMLPNDPQDVPECIGEAGGEGLHATAQCVPNTEVVDVSRFEDCEGELATCADRYAYPVAYITETQGETVEEEIDEAWEQYIDNTIETGNDRVNANPKCYVPLSVCPGIIRWDCVAERYAETVATSLSEHQLTYWEAVHESLLTNTPQALWWKDPLPELGAVISPVTALTPNPNVYQQLLEQPEDSTYYLGPPIFPNLPVPNLPGAIEEPNPGLYEKELRKYDLELASLLEYQQFGYSGFFITHGDFQLQTFFKVLSGPYLWVWCLTPTIIPVPIPLPVPVPIVIPAVPKAFNKWDAIPEGYPLPWVQGDPIWIGQ